MKKRRAIALILVLIMIIPQCTGLAYASSTPKTSKVVSYTHQGTTLKIDWKQISGVTGYQVQYASDRFFMNRHSFKTGHQDLTTHTFTKVSVKTIYIRVRTYKKDDDGNETYSDWAFSSNCKVNKYAYRTRLKKDGENFELRSLAKESVGSYDTLQGGCTYGDIGWFILYDRNVSKCKIIRMNMKTKKILKKSSALNVCHGSSLTYNPDRKELCVAHGPYSYKTVSTVDPKTLRLKKTVTLTLSSSTPGSSSSRAKGFRGITAIAYNNYHHCYVTRLKSQGNTVCYDGNFKPIKYITLGKKGGQLYQGIDSINDFILISQSPANGGTHNIISIYSWNGDYLSTLSLNEKYEIETIFHRNGSLYAGFYRSYYKTYYVDKWQIRTYNGSPSKVKTRLKYTKLMRSNYLYKITGL